MAAVKMKYLTEDEVKAVADSIVQRKFEKYGLGDTGIIEEEDFDGAQIFRMTADVQEKVPAEILIDALEEIHRALRSRGENRYVYLSTNRPGEQDVDEDAE